jgi:hypothetical protein
MLLPFQTSRRMEQLKNSSSKHWLFDDANHTAGDMPVCLCCGEDVDVEQDYRPVLPFCKLLCVGEMSQVSELGSCREISAGPDLQSHRAPPRAANEMRLGLRRRAYGDPDARALHRIIGAAGSRRRRGSTRGNSESCGGRPPRRRMLYRWALRSANHGEPGARTSADARSGRQPLTKWTAPRAEPESQAWTPGGGRRMLYGWGAAPGSPLDG